MNKKKKNLIVWNINDDKDMRELIHEKLDRIAPGLKIKNFSNCLEARESSGTVDVVLVDMTTMSAVSEGPSAAYGPIANIVHKHPQAHYIIVSAVLPDFAEIVIEQIKSIEPDSQVEYCYLPYFFDGDIEDVLISRGYVNPKKD